MYSSFSWLVYGYNRTADGACDFDMCTGSFDDDIVVPSGEPGKHLNTEFF